MPTPADFKKLPPAIESRLKDITNDHVDLLRYRAACARDIVPALKGRIEQIPFMLPAEQVVPGKTLQGLRAENSGRLAIDIRAVLGLEPLNNIHVASQPLKPLRIFMFGHVDAKPEELKATAAALSRAYDDVESHTTNVMYVKIITTSKDFHAALMHGQQENAYAPLPSSVIDYFAEGHSGATLIDRTARLELDKASLAADIEKAGMGNGRACIDEYIAANQRKY